MRFLKLILVLAVSFLWIGTLNRPIGPIPAIGKFLDPVNGFWANAEAANDHFSLSKELLSKHLKISMDERLVPHIHARNDYDLYFAQGYLHAYYRLWQMDMQTRAAAGRLSEIIGKKTLEYDRTQRRKGMVWAAENTLRAMQENPKTRSMLAAYTAGVNAYIHSLTSKTLPLEYKLMNFRPEDWSPLKCALLLKYMADDLTGNTDDIALSYVHDALGDTAFNRLYPERIPNNIPVIPRGTVFSKPSLPVPPVPPGNLFADFHIKDSSSTGLAQQLVFEINSGIGSNNWAVSGVKTLSGNPILCNDPHLGLNLPSIWYEIQLSAPGINCYGVSIPGAPGIVIGFNDSISWGLTNNYRDVKDYYELRSDKPGFYLIDHKELPFHVRKEQIYIKGEKQPFTDTVRYSIHGPVIYDHAFPEPSGSSKTLAMSWMAHRGTNELLSLYLLNRAVNYSDFVQAIIHFECPAQNFIYADCAGNIAIWGQGRFINKWQGQGKFVMRGDISATLWGDTIPMLENPHVLNPSQHFLASANQQVTDESYPYYYDGDFSEFRSWEINYFLNNSSKIKIEDMMALQNNTWSMQAHLLAPYYFTYGKDYAGDHPAYFQNWNDSLIAESKIASAFQIWIYFLNENIWKDDFAHLPVVIYPAFERTMQLILEDTTSPFFDNIGTKEKERFAQVAQHSFQQTWDSISKLEKRKGSDWYKVKNTSVMHLAKIGAFSFTGLKTGGWGNTINAMKQNHGPSWRMIVTMNPGKIEAWGVYPGGQSGNPGSKAYNSFLDYWVEGKYFPIRFDPK